MQNIRNTSERIDSGILDFKGLSIKYVHSQGEGRKRELSNSDTFRTTQTSVVFVANNLDFFKIFGVFARIREAGELSQFCAKGGVGLIFRDFVQTSLTEGP